MSHPQNPGGNPFDENDSRPGPPDYNRGNNYDPYSHPENSPYSPYGNDPFGAPGYGGNQPGYPTNNYGGPNYGTPMANPTYMNPGAPNAAGPWRRLLAYFLDSIVVGILGSILAGIFFTIPTPPQAETEAEINRFLTDLTSFSASMTVFSAVLFFFYATFCQTTNFQTLGKRAAGIRAVDADGQKLPVLKSALRNVWLLIPAIPFLGWASNLVGILIFIFAFMGDRTQGLNDKWAKTRVLTR